MGAPYSFTFQRTEVKYRIPADRYEAEPYVLAADVYAEDESGRAGWSWYTGAAGWYLRVALEDLLGLRLRGGQLTVKPNLPPDWAPCTVHWRDGAGETHTITLTQSAVTVDGEPYSGAPIGTPRKTAE